MEDQPSGMGILLGQELKLLQDQSGDWDRPVRRGGMGKEDRWTMDSGETSLSNTVTVDGDNCPDRKPRNRVCRSSSFRFVLPDSKSSLLITHGK
jgi:hypothetical protein